MNQRQDSVDAQLRDVVRIANEAGCYDAADAIKRAFFPAMPLPPEVVEYMADPLREQFDQMNARSFRAAPTEVR